jgi:hypothetical protein
MSTPLPFRSSYLAQIRCAPGPGPQHLCSVGLLLPSKTRSVDQGRTTALTEVRFALRATCGRGRRFNERDFCPVYVRLTRIGALEHCRVCRAPLSRGVTALANGERVKNGYFPIVAYRGSICLNKRKRTFADVRPGADIQFFSNGSSTAGGSLKGRASFSKRR